MAPGSTGLITKVTIPAAEWDRLMSWAEAPPKVVPALQALAATRLAGED